MPYLTDLSQQGYVSLAIPAVTCGPFWLIRLKISCGWWMGRLSP
jgi:hypothetical protein